MSDDATPRLGLPYLAAGQAQKHVTLNEALSRLDGLVQPAVASRTVAAQPADPMDGALHILPAGASGADWGGKPVGTLMRFEAGAWEALPIQPGFLAWIADEQILAVRTEAGWAALSSTFRNLTAALSPRGAATRFEIREQELTLAGASVASTLLIPARSIVLGVSTRTTQAVTGATSYSCGVAGEAGKFGSLLGAAPGSANIGVVGPAAFYADTPVILTAASGAFTGGRVRLSIHLMTFEGAAS
ncbi:DUF2793 domain-containing protein [Caulobacter sp. NIBR2454]|uniref:DUF2793 domain-containing protein n=1 Tax=Caulobacter sp. NIBR2454 TaxID=3015996 RepID=UPI0022B61E6A|nr:DUF2793 domain-containing protein [Caulobacter sp. NIBR2454]